MELPNEIVFLHYDIFTHLCLFDIKLLPLCYAKFLSLWNFLISVTFSLSDVANLLSARNKLKSFLFKTSLFFCVRLLFHAKFFIQIILCIHFVILLTRRTTVVWCNKGKGNVFGFCIWNFFRNTRIGKNDCPWP